MIIEGKKALITGGGAGFGLCLTQRLIEAGASVIVLDNNASSISALEKRFLTSVALFVMLVLMCRLIER